MTLTAEQQAKFAELTLQIIKWLNDSGHPHTTILVTTTSAELLEGVEAFTTHDHIKD